MIFRRIRWKIASAMHLVNTSFFYAVNLPSKLQRRTKLNELFFALVEIMKSFNFAIGLVIYIDIYGKIDKRDERKKRDESRSRGQTKRDDIHPAK